MILLYYTAFQKRKPASSIQHPASSTLTLSIGIRQTSANRKQDLACPIRGQVRAIEIGALGKYIIQGVSSQEGFVIPDRLIHWRHNAERMGIALFRISKEKRRRTDATFSHLQPPSATFSHLQPPCAPTFKGFSPSAFPLSRILSRFLQAEALEEPGICIDRLGKAYHHQPLPRSRARYSILSCSNPRTRRYRQWLTRRNGRPAARVGQAGR